MLANLTRSATAVLPACSIFAGVAQRLLHTGPAAFAPAKGQKGKSGQSQQAEEEEAPYTYLPPGSSIRDPSYGAGHSMGNPVYQYDPKPSAFSLSDPLPNQTVKKPRKKKGPLPMSHQRVKSRPAPKKDDDAYTYLPPGSSIRDPAYGMGHSLGNPVYQYDPKPSSVDLADPAPKATFKPKPQTEQAGGAPQKEASNVADMSVKEPVYFVDPAPGTIPSAAPAPGTAKGAK